LTITLGIAWALFILAPGLAVFAALYTSDGGVVSPAPPAPNSFTALSVVIFGALAAHAVGAGLFALNDVISLFWSPLEVPWNPNPYAYFLSARPAVDRHLGLEICFLLALLLSLSAAAYAAVRHTVDQDEKVSVKRSWAAILTQLSPEPDYDKHLAAYIVTDMEAEKGWIGYEGEVEGVALDTDKQIVALTLRNCQAFKLQPTKDNLNHQVIARAAAIPLLMIDRSQIKNVALQVVFQQKP
jgi:hypothetical protein